MPPPKAKFVRTIFATSSLKRSELMLDFCKGPIAVFVGEHRPRLIAEHDYCGGLDVDAQARQGRRDQALG